MGRGRACSARLPWHGSGTGRGRGPGVEGTRTSDAAPLPSGQAARLTRGHGLPDAALDRVGRWRGPHGALSFGNVSRTSVRSSGWTRSVSKPTAKCASRPRHRLRPSSARGMTRRRRGARRTASAAGCAESSAASARTSASCCTACGPGNAPGAFRKVIESADRALHHVVRNSEGRTARADSAAPCRACGSSLQVIVGRRLDTEAVAHRPAGTLGIPVGGHGHPPRSGAAARRPVVGRNRWGGTGRGQQITTRSMVEDRSVRS